MPMGCLGQPDEVCACRARAAAAAAADDDELPAGNPAEQQFTRTIIPIYYIMRNLQSRSSCYTEFGSLLTTVNVGKMTASSQSSSATACFLGVPLPAI